MIALARTAAAAWLLALWAPAGLALAYDPAFFEDLLFLPNGPEDYRYERPLESLTREERDLRSELNAQGKPLPDSYYLVRTRWSPEFLLWATMGTDLHTRGRMTGHDDFSLRLAGRVRSGFLTGGLELMTVSHVGPARQARGRGTDDIRAWAGVRHMMGTLFIEALAESQPVYASWRDLAGFDEAPRGASAAMGGWLVREQAMWVGGELRWAERHTPEAGRCGIASVIVAPHSFPAIVVEGTWDDGWAQPGLAVEPRWSRLSVTLQLAVVELGVVVDRLVRRRVDVFFRYTFPLSGASTQAALPLWAQSMAMVSTVSEPPK